MLCDTSLAPPQLSSGATMKPMTRNRQIRSGSAFLALLSVLVLAAAPLATAAMLCQPPAAESPFSCHEPPPSCTSGADGSDSCCAVMSCFTSATPQDNVAQPAHLVELVTTLQKSSVDQVVVAARPLLPERPHSPPAREKLSLLSTLLI